MKEHASINKKKIIITLSYFFNTGMIQFSEKFAKINAAVFWLKIKTECYLVRLKIEINVIIQFLDNICTYNLSYEINNNESI